MKKYCAEFIGTFILVVFGVGTAVIAGDKVGVVGIAFAFGLGLVAAAYGIGPVSGCHINPAVSLGVFTAGRMSFGDMIGYWVGQFLGAFAGAGVVLAIANGVPGGYSPLLTGLGQNGFGAGYQGEYSMMAALVYEVIATMIFLIVILGSTQNSAPAGFAGLVIGLTLVAIHLLGIRVDGTSVNPARSLGPAILVGGKALSQVWLFFIGPFMGAIIAGFLFRRKALAAE